MPYRPQLKTANGLVDFPLDAETVKGKTILEQTYPVGAIYISVNNTSPASLFGGTWQQLKDRFLLGAGDTYTNGNTGGEATHQLTVDEIPAHRHDLYIARSGGFAANTIVQDSAWSGGSDVMNYSPNMPYPIGVQNTGGGQAHNNMPPYLTVYMWKRTA